MGGTNELMGGTNELMGGTNFTPRQYDN